MKKKLVKILIVLFVLAAVLVSKGWVKEISQENPNESSKANVYSIKGKSLENFRPLINTVKYDAMKYDQCY